MSTDLTIPVPSDYPELREIISLELTRLLQRQKLNDIGVGWITDLDPVTVRLLDGEDIQPILKATHISPTYGLKVAVRKSVDGWIIQDYIHPISAAAVTFPQDMVLLGSDVGGTATMSVTVPTGYRHLQVKARINHDQGSTFTPNLRIRLNNISTTTYRGVRNSYPADGSTGLIGQIIGTGGGAGATEWSCDIGNAGGSAEIFIVDYLSSGLKSIQFDSFARIGNAATSMKKITIDGYNDTLTTAITSIQLLCSGGNWDAGSRMDVFGLRAL